MVTTPYQYVNSTGTIVPDTENILAGIQTEYQGIFGSDLIVTPDTPQGMLITADALARTETVQNNAAIANQINPNIAAGTFLDAILALTGMQRLAATQTVVPNVTLTGVNGTVIPAGSQASTASGVLFSSAANCTIASGTATVNFIANDYGPIACDIHQLTQIVSNINGWETVLNGTAGTLGQGVQSDQAARAMRLNTLAFQGIGLAEAIKSALYNVPGVTSLTFLENTDSGTDTISGITMVGHSIWTCVEGGTDLAVASALLENKSLGCAWNGGTSVVLTEPASGQNYTVLFDRPTPVEFLVRVTTSNGNSTNIQNAIIAWMNGTVDGLPGLTVGEDVSPFSISAAINSLYPSYFISKVELSASGGSPSYSTNTMVMNINQIAFTQISDITVVIA
jgi:uncharacterized phage protein gp47/JayE